MPIPGVETWVLTFLLAFPDSFIGGEYQTKERCEYAAVHQLQHCAPNFATGVRCGKIDADALAGLLAARFG